MSASLVGSEMCIRDRPWSARARPRKQPRQRPRGSAPRGRTTPRPWRRAAVSYTHLTLPTICSV
eukprot:3468378-Alexandrium_andersonii.AAC.1